MGKFVIETSGLEVTIKNKHILKGIDLSIEQGSFHGIIGPNGAGKTTLFTTLQGYRNPTKGSAKVLGVNPYPRNIELLARIGVQPQNSAFFPKTTLREHLSVVASIHKVSNSRVEHLIESLNLTHIADTKVESLSGGERQRLAVATAIVHKPEILFLDEPTAGLDPEARKNLVHLLQETDLGVTTILYTTHFLDEAERLCDQITIIDSGSVLLTDKPSQLIAEANLGSRVFLPYALEKTDILISKFGAHAIQVNTDGVQIQTQDTANLFEELKNLEINTQGVRVENTSLEDVYFRLIGKESGE